MVSGAEWNYLRQSRSPDKKGTIWGIEACIPVDSKHLTMKKKLRLFFSLSFSSPLFRWMADRLPVWGPLVDLPNCCIVWSLSISVSSIRPFLRNYIMEWIIETSLLLPFLGVKKCSRIEIHKSDDLMRWLLSPRRIDAAANENDGI